MDLPELTSHSFVVKIWLERESGDARGAKWRGHITHVFDREMRYMDDLDDIPAFIWPYLTQMGVRFGARWRVRLWLGAVQRWWRRRRTG